MRVGRVLGAPVLAVALLAGCTGASEPDGNRRPTATASATSAQDLAVEDFAAAILHSEKITHDEAGLTDPVATLTVPVSASSDRVVDVEVAVVAVSASEGGTDLVFSLRTADGSDSPRSEYYSWGSSFQSDLRSIELRPDAEMSLKPYTVMNKPDIELDALCACSDFPKDVTGSPQVRTVLYPPLPAGTTHVGLAFPGAEPVTVPVTWQ